MQFNQPKLSFPSGPAQQPFEQRRGTVERLEAAQGGYHRVFGYAGITFPGEAVLDVPFSIVFIAKPLFTCGFELAPESNLTAGNFPTCTGLVTAWDRRVTSDENAEYFYGASLAIRTTGHDEQRFILHWQFMGKALRGPGPDLAAP